MKKTVLIIVFFLMASTAQASEFHCAASRATDDMGDWPQDRLEKWKPGVVIQVYPKGSEKSNTISRCSWSKIEGRRTCDTYPMDHAVTSIISNGSMTIYKFYHFKGQMDVQLYLPAGQNSSGLYIENNGRGAVYRGACVEVGSVNPPGERPNK